MNKIISIFAILLFSTGAYAAGCDNGSLKGKYGYEVSGVNEFPLPPTFADSTKVTRSTHVVGQAFFDGQGHFDITGYGSAAGSVAERNGNGTYTVNPDDCTAKGSLTWNTGETSEFHIVLAHTDNSDSHSSKKAYQASVLVSTDGKTVLGTYPSSASGSLTRLNGKFN